MYGYQGEGKVEAIARLGLTHLQSYLTLLRPYGLYSLPGSSVHGILQERILEWVTISFSTKQVLMASTSLDHEEAQERQRLLKFLTQGLVPRKFSTHSKFTVNNDEEHSWWFN